MSDDTFTASDFTSAEASASSEPAASVSTSGESSAPVDLAAQPGEATTQPAAATDSLSTEPDENTPGPRLKDHQRILENARQKAVAEYQQRYGWAEQVSAEEFQQIQSIARHFASGNQLEGIKALLNEARKDPTVEAQLRSEAARILAQRAQPTGPDLHPIQVQLENGQTVGLYSAEQIAALKDQWLSAVEQKLQPLQQSHAQQQQAAEAARFEAAWTQWQTRTVSDAASWPGMDNPDTRAQFAQEVGRNIERIPANRVDLIEREIDRAYRKVVVPTLATSSRQAVLNDINRHANASTVNPGRTTTRVPKSMDDMSIAEALQHVAAQQGA